MSPTLSSRTILALLILTAAVGALDAAVGGQWDLFAVTAVVVVLGLALAALSSWRRPLVPLRADLARWLARYAAEGGEQTAAVADRAVAAYRAGLVGDGPRDRAGGGPSDGPSDEADDRARTTHAP